MKMMCKLHRPNGTQVTLGGVTYDFQPDAHGRHVCEVEREDHQDIFLSIPEGYRPLVEDAEPARVEGKVPSQAQTLSPGSTGGEDEDDTDTASADETEGEEPEGEEPASDTDEEIDLEALDDDALAKLYADVMGKKPNGRASRDTLIKHIVEKAGN